MNTVYLVNVDERHLFGRKKQERFLVRMLSEKTGDVGV